MIDVLPLLHKPIAELTHDEFLVVQAYERQRKDLAAKTKQLPQSFYDGQQLQPVTTESFTTALLSKRQRSWYLLSTPKMGEVKGCPQHRGLLIARNDDGLGLIQLQDGSLIDCHLDWFVPDKQTKESKGQQSASTATKRSKLQERMEQYV